MKQDDSCIVFGCSNKKYQGEFVGNICYPCYNIITTGDTNQRSDNFIIAMADKLRSLDVNEKVKTTPIISLTEVKIEFIKEYLGRLFERAEFNNYNSLEDIHKEVRSNILSLIFNDALEDYSLTLCDR